MPEINQEQFLKTIAFVKAYVDNYANNEVSKYRPKYRQAYKDAIVKRVYTELMEAIIKQEKPC